MQPTLLIMAAGIGSRYGGIKQLDEFGPGGETIIDYSVYDALQAGFGKVVFIIQRSIEDAARARFAHRFGPTVPVEFVCQELDTMLPDGFKAPVDRTKPWGTGQAVLVAKDRINEPFAVINADDFYGRHAFATIADWLRTDVRADRYALVGYKLRNALSEHGTVSRGICDVNPGGILERIVEHTKVRQTESGAESIGETPNPVVLTGEEPVSMSLFGFHPSIFHHLTEQFAAFMAKAGTTPAREFYITSALDRLINAGTVQIQVLPTDETWFGVTYRDDVPIVQRKIAHKIEVGEYPRTLWS